MAGHDIIVIGASAGGVEALRDVAAGLPPDFPAAVFIVLHTRPSGPHLLPGILARAGRLPAKSAESMAPIEPGTIYVAPPDFHLILEPGRMRLRQGPRENMHRPAIDPLFRSAARHYGARVAGVILTGSLDDGTAGLIAVKRRGGLAIVQDPENAMFSGMPRSALDHADVDHCVPLAEIAPLLDRVSRQPGARHVTPGHNPGKPVERNSRVEGGPDMRGKGEQHLAPFTCPECHGNLWEIPEGKFSHFRCRVGHEFSPQGLIEAHGEAVGRALWSALKVLEESAAAGYRLSADSRREGNMMLANEYERRAREKDRDAGAIRDLLTNVRHLPHGAPSVQEPAQ